VFVRARVQTQRCGNLGEQRNPIISKVYWNFLLGKWLLLQHNIPYTLFFLSYFKHIIHKSNELNLS